MLLWPEQLPVKGHRWKPNPMPRVPNTGWKPCDNFPSLSGAKAIAVDVETYDPEIEDHGPGWGRGKGHIIGISLATDDGFNKYFPIRHETGFNHDPQQIIRYVREQLRHAHQPKVGHNLLYDLGWLAHEGIPVIGQTYCTWSAEKLLDHSSSAALEEVSQRYLGEGKSSEALYDWAWQAWGRGVPKSPGDKRKLAMKNLYRIPSELVGFYAESDTALPLQILPMQFEKMDELGLLEVFHMECDLLPVLVQMRLLGVSVDLDAAERARDEFLNTAAEVQRKVDEIAGCSINTGSAQEIAKVFDRLKIRYPRTEKTDAPSFKGEFLKTVEHPIGALIVELEELKKFQSTFIDNAILGSHVNGRIHGEVNPMRAVTGRMSHSNPNTGQIPSRSELAKTVRSIFVPDVGHDHWRKVDYSSVESRILAHFAVGQKSKELRNQYRAQPMTDYHQFTIDMVKSVTGIEIVRKHAKIINFGLCIAEGQLVLTDRGLVPIEKISLAHRIWDGIEWVHHEGVIYKGIKEVIEYEGITATPDHKVWVADGSTSTLGEAKKCALHLARTQTACGSPQTYWADCFSRNSEKAGRGILQSDDAVRLLRETSGEGSEEHGGGTISKVSMRFSPHQIPGRKSSDAGRSLSVYDSAVPEGDAQLSPELQGKRYQGAVRVLRTLCQVGFREMAGFVFQKVGVRSYQQRRALLPGQSSLGNFLTKQDEYEAERKPLAGFCPQREQPHAEVFDHDMLQHDYERDDRRGDLGAVREEQGQGGQEERESSTGVRVYDILNAGPRRRFTCSGILVSNCYGASEKKLASMLGISQEEATPLFEAFHTGLPYVKTTMEESSRYVEQNGHSRTILGRRTNFNYWEPKYVPRGAPRPTPLIFDKAIRAYGPNIKRSHLHKAVNAIIQGSAADLMKMAMVKCYKQGLFDAVGFPRLVVHDELDWSMPADIKESDFNEVMHTMETAIPFKIPIRVEGEWGPNWSELYALKDK
jgi:DNA polymerase-1